MGKSKTTHQLQRIFHKLRIHLPAGLIEPFDQLRDRNMFFGLQKYFQDLKAIFEVVDVFLFKQLLLSHLLQVKHWQVLPHN